MVSEWFWTPLKTLLFTWLLHRHKSANIFAVFISSVLLDASRLFTDIIPEMHSSRACISSQNYLFFFLKKLQAECNVALWSSFTLSYTGWKNNQIFCYCPKQQGHYAIAIQNLFSYKAGVAYLLILFWSVSILCLINGCFTCVSNAFVSFLYANK